MKMEFPPPNVDFYESANCKDAREKVAQVPVLVLYGLSGSGKTQICCYLAQEFKRNHSALTCFINSKNSVSLKNDLTKICSELSLSLDLDKEKILPDFFKALSSYLVSKSKSAVVILDDVDKIDDVLSVVYAADRNADLKNVSVLITSLVKPGNVFSRKPNIAIINADGFTDDDAALYLDIPRDRLKEVLESIERLPIGLSAFKGALDSDILETKDEFIDRYLSQMNQSTEDNKALQCIKFCLEDAAKANPLLQKIVKYFSVFSGDNITIQLLVSLLEEVDYFQGIDEAEKIYETLMRRSLCNTSESSTRKRYMSFHPLVIKAIESEIKEDEKSDILRVSLQAFSRVMPRDDRHHQNDVTPRMLEHATSLLQSYNNVKQSIGGLTKLLCAELHTSIGYCMKSHKLNINDAINKLEEGKDLFLELFFDENFKGNFEDDITKCLQSSNIEENKRFMPNDDRYIAYAQSLQVYHRLTLRDLATLFPDLADRANNEKSGHLTKSALYQLRQRNDGSLLCLEQLGSIYPLELFAHHLHILSKYYFHLNKDPSKSKEVSMKADVIYNSIKQHCGVALLGMYINKRFLLYLQTELFKMKTDSENPEGLKKLREDWERLGAEPTGKVYECGIVRSIDMSQDDYHKLNCLEGEMLVYGVIASKTSDIVDKKQQVANGESLVVKIEKLCEEHQKKHVTYSRAYIEVSRFYLLCNEHQEAVSYSVKSMMEYRNDCLKKQKRSEGHPELDDDNRNRFHDIYEQLVSCVSAFKAVGFKDKLRMKKDEKKYLEEVQKAWQEKCQCKLEGGDQTFKIIDELLAILHTEVLHAQDEGDAIFD